jgi:hypothetical protein
MAEEPREESDRRREDPTELAAQYRGFLAMLKERASRRRRQAREGSEPPPIPPYTDEHPPPPPSPGTRGY